MLRDELTAVIERESDTNIRIAPQLAEICIFAREDMPPGSGMPTGEITAACPEASRRRLNRLADEIGLLNKDESTKYLVNGRTDDRFWSTESMERAVDEELRRIGRHATGGPASPSTRRRRSRCFTGRC